MFLNNWKVITQDQWVINCVQGYTLDLIQYPHQQQTPKELVFPQKETQSLSEEVQAMLHKQAITVVPKEQAAKGFHSQLFSVPKKYGGTDQ